MPDCLFCKIVKKEIPVEVLAESETALAFKDINSQAPVHILIIPKAHIKSAAEIKSDSASLMGDMTLLANKLAKENKIEDAFRLVMNSGAGAGQSVFHLHMHLLGGRDFTWPPG